MDPLEKGERGKDRSGNKNSDSFQNRVHILATVAPLVFSILTTGFNSHDESVSFAHIRNLLVFSHILN